MSGRKFYCFCDANCKFETMNKEQILAALSDLMSKAHVEDGCLYLDFDASAFEGMDDGAFITKVKESNAGGDVSFWIGTEAQFNAIAPTVEADSVIARIDKNGKVYICTDDSFTAFLRRTVQADKIMVGDEELTADTIYKLRNKIFDASYTIDSKDSFHAAMIEQASRMNIGEERLVYFYDKVPTVFYNGYAIAKLYSVEAHAQETDFRVCADIYTGSKWFMTVTKDEEGAWTCSDIVRVATSTELANYYTAAEVDQKLANIGSGGSAGMCREFDSGVINATSYTWNGNASKFYTLHLRGDGYNYSATIDYRHLNQPIIEAAAGTMYFTIPVKDDWVQILVSVKMDGSGNKSVTFYIGVEWQEKFSFIHICGYY